MTGQGQALFDGLPVEQMAQAEIPTAGFPAFADGDSQNALAIGCFDASTVGFFGVGRDAAGAAGQLAGDFSTAKVVAQGFCVLPDQIEQV